MLFHREKKAPLTPEVQRQKMLTMPISRLIWGMIIPTVLSQMITVFYNTADTFFVARIGTSAAAAVGIVFSLQSIMQAYGFGIGTGVGSLVARCLGAAQNEAAERYVSSSLAAALAGALVIMVPSLIFLPELMRLLGSTETMLPYCVAYARIILLGCPFMCLQSVLSCVLRNEGEPIYAVVGLVIGGFVNVVLDPVLIFVAGWGVSGAAAATVLGQMLSFSILLYAFLAGKSIVKINLHNISREGKEYMEIFTT
ncbi:MAG: MATE family efflux transporter, partial [Peptococcaceae bacterium]|nr:MATE family efflux transporter [Peptococcaceae bacterium]